VVVLAPGNEGFMTIHTFGLVVLGCVLATSQVRAQPRGPILSEKIRLATCTGSTVDGNDESKTINLELVMYAPMKEAALGFDLDSGAMAFHSVTKEKVVEGAEPISDKKVGLLVSKVKYSFSKPTLTAEPLMIGKKSDLKIDLVALTGSFEAGSGREKISVALKCERDELTSLLLEISPHP